MIYEKFYAFLKSTHKLAKVLDSDFYTLFKKSASMIQDHTDFLYAKFLGLDNPEKIPSDEVVLSQIKKEIHRLTELREDYALQDNIYALKQKNQCDILIGLLKDIIE